jgi:hypothetical protein
MKKEFKDQNEKCDFCNESAIFKVKSNDNDWSISCEQHKKDALESLEKKCSCGHSKNFHNQKEGCMFQFPLDSNADYKDNQGICVCTEFVETKSITCDVCNNSFDYQVWDIKGIGENDARPADELPDGYLIGGYWICQDCGSCSECGTSLEKEGNMLDNSENKLCRDCKIFTIDFFSCFCTAQSLEEADRKSVV